MSEGVDSSLSRIDHVMVVTSDLLAGVREFEEGTGITPVWGGRHTRFGTANYLVGLAQAPGARGSAPYLEIMGPDPSDQGSGLDETGKVLVGDSRELSLRMWVISSRDIESDALRAADRGFPTGSPVTMSRPSPAGGKLEWQVTVKVPPALRGAQPALIDWGQSDHPSQSLTPLASIEDLQLQSPDPDRMMRMQDAFGLSGEVLVAEHDGFAIDLTTPKGRVRITTEGIETCRT